MGSEPQHAVPMIDARDAMISWSFETGRARLDVYALFTRRLSLRLAVGVQPITTNVTFYNEHPRRVIKLLADILVDAPELASTATDGRLGLIMGIAACKVRRKLLRPAAA